MKQRKFTILLVDDSDPDRFLLRREFQSLSTKYQVQDLCNGDEALAYLQGEGKYADRSKFPFPGYIITDLNMSPGDGFLILDFIKHHPALSVIPVVMLSSSDHPDDIRTAYYLGASSYIIKPDNKDALRALVKHLHEYWTQCEVPEVDESGFALATDSVGRPGQPYPKPKRRNQKQKEPVN